ncbi:MAG: hypothetical protein P1U91_00795 [Pseudophaeobacter sp. bin_em_oilr2.035]|uniref:Uncharacterized protein n=1 Tax=Phaeobacter gallaeciensis TaxID=60890 RepID=A0ABD4X4C6_9RHOB|nr:hypothetical protein [Phaeobacter gallaeciensis]MDF1770470.1 hypothetical protein [Pseudophaeobacter sp. bin_em_oilr2.035]MDE4143192.1 hypothetical protein [Phaeobacter gallaeciensis]MDE4156446.1 hypothetical protein [Phaeobacter gallaeciensis]MDE4160633.1 hypothetical protein [Phaeobacter gallaeciensis]MDE4164273.1 hypothetical protein [Phaeobacter gallaeciensis]
MPEIVSSKSGETEAIILIKAAPVIGSKHGETVCCAGIDIYGNWLRMYPVSFRVLDDTKKFKRWDKVKFKWRRPSDDMRLESRHVDSQSLEIIGRMPDREKTPFLDHLIVTSLTAQREKGLSLALLKPTIQGFHIERRPQTELDFEQARIDEFHSQEDMFIPRPAVPQQACPYSFKYKYTTDDGDRDGTCQDWETEATFFKWRNLYGEQDALQRMQIQFGEVLPERGLYFAMGTHSRWPDTWLINGLIQLRTTGQASLF